MLSQHYQKKNQTTIDIRFLFYFQVGKLKGLRNKVVCVWGGGGYNLNGD